MNIQRASTVSISINKCVHTYAYIYYIYAYYIQCIHTYTHAYTFYGGVRLGEGRD